MWARLGNWLDNRLGYRHFLKLLLLEEIPGGARWRYVWGSTLLFVFLLQAFTGVLLMTAYSPGSSTAWGSVYFIQYEMDFGWFIRGLHHFGSQAMIVLLGVHLLQVVLAGAQLPPRELNWWLGLGLLGCVLGLGLTGYLLPWDQKGFWATQVATNILGNVPGIGPFLQRLAVGGPSYGHHTLTRFFTLHVAVLPGLLVLLAVLHLVVFRRHGVTAPAEARQQPSGWFWPDQAFRDLLACLAVFAVLVFLVLQVHGHPLPPVGEAADAENNSWYARWAHAGREGRGANLDAPADPERQYPARPEWYFLFLFQLLKYFPGEWEVVGTVFLPLGVGLLLALLPLLGYGRCRPVGRVVGVLVVVGLLAGIASLTLLALADDMPEASARALLDWLAQRAIPALTALYLLYLAALGVLPVGRSRQTLFWLGVVLGAGALAGVGGLVYAAQTQQVPAVVAAWLAERQQAAALSPEERQRQQERQEAAAKFQQDVQEAGRLAERALVLAQRGIPPAGATELVRRDPKGLFLRYCAGCHSFGDFGPADFHTRQEPGFDKAQFKASDLAGWGTEEWLYEFLCQPQAVRFLGRCKDEQGEPRFTRMADWVQQRWRQYQGKEAQLREQFRKIARWLATSPRSRPAPGSPHTEAYELFTKTFNCVRCHAFADHKGQKNVPQLTGYGSADWLQLFLQAPGLPHLYGENNAMPAFRDLEGAAGALTRQEYAQLLGKKVEEIPFVSISPAERAELVRYLAQEQRQGLPEAISRRE
jgi:quinol-cytochrome oxidoreductase complex cytochrome b subunit/mono/diheme cytochrome c family protein